MDISTTYNLNDEEELDKLALALNASTRRKMLRLLAKNSYSVVGIAEKLNISVSNATFHLKLLKAAHLIKIQPNPNKRGNEKIIAQDIALVTLDLKEVINFETHEYVANIPIGSYIKHEIAPPCGMVNSDGMIFMHDNPNVFYSPERFTAVLLSFTKGYVEYAVPAFEYKDKLIESFTFSLELCSECPNYNNTYKSDITFWLNGIEICTYRSMGDYGDRHGKYAIPHWPANSTQYGMLKKIRIDSTGTYIDERLVSDITIAELNLTNRDIIPLRIGIKDNARYVGGINIFGKNCGDTNQDIVIHVSYRIPSL